MRLGVIASHEGTTLRSLIDACDDGQLHAVVSVVVSNNGDSGALRRARQAAIPAFHLSGKTHPDESELDQAICDVLHGYEVDLVVLAGYMKKIGPVTLESFRGRILNTHPALLPKFGGRGMYGDFVHQAVLEAGERRSGASVFVVTEHYDAGPVIGQREVDVDPQDTVESLSARVKAAEKLLLVDVIEAVRCGTIPVGGLA